MKKFILAGVLFLGIVLIAGCGQQSIMPVDLNTLDPSLTTTSSIILNDRNTSTEKIIISVFFPNNKLDPNMLDCTKVFRTNRSIDNTVAVGRRSLEELFTGPTMQEKGDGYFTNIPAGVNIQKLTIENGLAKVDVSQELEQGVGGSCRVDSIRTQITETLKQFPTVQSVIISIDGRTEEILQP